MRSRLSILTLFLFASPALAAPKATPKPAVKQCDHSKPPIGVTEHAYTPSATLRNSVKTLFAKKGLRYPPRQIYLRAFKSEDQLELWAGNRRSALTLVKTFRICAKSGVLGPKRLSGDRQVPEGFYYINRFNPRSSYHVSLGLNYPNQSDRKVGRRLHGSRANLGNHIFIHGDCVTIGCIPLKDGPMEKLFQIAKDAQRVGQRRIPVHVFPRRMDDAAMAQLAKQPHASSALLAFWRNIQAGYLLFERNRRVPKVRVMGDGSYRIQAGR